MQQDATSRRVWDEALTARDREVYRGAGYGARAGGGQRPALIVVDVTYEFTGLKPEPILDSIKQYPNSCGEVAWEGMQQIRRLLDACRERSIPVFFTKAMDQLTTTTRGSWGWKKTEASASPAAADWQRANSIPDPIAPAEGETVIQKTKPSAFFGTPLVSYLVAAGIDTLIVTGTTTSGCVRATVIDAFSNNYRTIVAEDGVFDRGEASHRINLFDMHAKYADVQTTDEVLDYLATLGANRAPEAAAV
jgi:nicotinamidase-related amidase